MSGQEKKDPSAEDLLARARKLQQQSESLSEKKRLKEKRSTVGQISRQVSDTVETYNQVTGTIGWLYQNVFYPVATHPWAGAPFRLYRKIWNNVVYEVDKDGDRIFVKKRGGIMVLCTLAFLWMLPGILWVTTELLWDSSRMLTNYHRNEILYLGKSQEIDPIGNIFSAQGCEQIRCTDQTSIYFRIKPSLAHHIWSLWHNGNIFFPDFVTAGIQNDINKCTVTSYGSRGKFIMRNWDIYPQILALDCVPVSEADIKAFEADHNPEEGALSTKP
ncbi:MAG: hypothetical protein H6856_03540 [Rhodospirillales bacterium]|nr:hypothetical protein [Rhodospirillales bacterium]